MYAEKGEGGRVERDFLQKRVEGGVGKTIGTYQRYAFVRIMKSNIRNVNFCFWLVKDK